jgi:hypothetical protein
VLLVQPGIPFATLLQPFPHEPQLDTSVVVSTQAAEQSSRPGPQQMDGAPVQLKPFSVAQVDEHPSLSDVLPSSHVSGPSTVPLPQPLTHTPPTAQR